MGNLRGQQLECCLHSRTPEKECSFHMAELDTKSLYGVCDPSSFDFKTTEDIADYQSFL